MSKFCSQCGTPLPEGAMFCGNCGAPQKPVQPEPVPVVNSVEPVDVVAVAAPEPEVVESAPVFETQEVEVAAVVEPAAPIAEPVINEQPVVVPPVVEQPVPVQSPVAPAAPAKQQKKSKKWLFWAIPVAIVVILAIAAALLWKPLMLQFAPTAYLNMATTKTFSKLAERYEGSPSALFASTSEIMKKGTIDISVGTTGPENEQIKADISLGSDQENKQYAINGDLEMQGMTFDLDLYASNEVFALKLNPFTNGKYYGINYKSFDADIRTSALGDMLDEDTIAQISDIVDMVESAMDQSSDFEEILKPYLDKIAEFVRDTELTTDSAQIEVNDKNIKCDTITASFDKDGFVSLLEDLLDQLEKDEKLKETLTGGLSMVVVAGEDPYAEMIKTMRDALKDFEESIELEFDLTYYISKNALVAMGCELQMTADEEFGKFDAQMLISFGTDASKDDIETELKITAGESKGTVKIVSSVENKADSYCETMTVTVKSDEYKSITKMVYDWNRNDGDLCIKVSTEEDGEKSEYSYDLILKETDKGFQIGCEDISDLIQSGENNDLSDDFIQTLDYVADENQSAPISVMITYSKGCQISKPDFINLDQIDDEALAEIMSNLGLGGEGEEDEEDPDDSWGDDIVGEQDVYTKDSYSEPDHIVIDNSYIVVGTVGKQWLTNGQLQIYYWNAVYDF